MFNRLILSFTLFLFCLGAIAENAPRPTCYGIDLLKTLQFQSPDAHTQLMEKMDQTPNSRGVYWRIEHPETGVLSLLLGTMHSSDPRVIRSIPDLVNQALEVGDWSPLVEITIADQAAFLARLSDLAFIMADRGKNFDTGFSKAQKELAKRVLAEYSAKTTYENQRQLKSFFTLALLAYPPCILPHVDQYPSQDQFLQFIAGGRELGLETIDEQMNKLDSLSPKTMKNLLLASFTTANDGENYYETLLKAYLREEPYQVVLYSESIAPELSKKTGIDFQSSWDEFMQVLVVDRNHTMVERAIPHLLKGKKVMAVGALHLPGEEGIIELLRKQGFVLTRLQR